MTMFVPVKDLVVPLPSAFKGFTLAPSAHSPRLLQLTFARDTLSAFLVP